MPKSACFDEGESLSAQVLDGRGRLPPTTIDVRTLVIALSCRVEISAVCSFVLSQSMHVTDRQNYDFQDGDSIAALHSKNYSLQFD